MNFFHSNLRDLVRGLLALAAGGVLFAQTAVAADAPDAAPAPAPAKAAAGGGTTWYVFSPPKDSNEVLAANLRLKLLTLTKAFIDRDRPELRTRLISADNPFYIKQAPPEPVAAPAATGPAQPAPPPKLTDEDRLKAVGDTLQPTGILEGAGKRVVTFSGSGGGTIEVGQSFSVTIQPDPAPVSIQLVDANDTSCVLKLNNTTVSISYVSKTSGAGHAPPSSTSSQPKSRD
ncbi:MAG TPA: hypothetical protein VHC95_08725 [Opitutales bacterium]|nr:hypothetical protein [Opitutales bacterium]